MYGTCVPSDKWTHTAHAAPGLVMIASSLQALQSPRCRPPAMGMKRQRSWTAMVGASQSSWMLSSGCRAGSSTGGSAAGVEKQEKGAKALIRSAGYQSFGKTLTGGHRCRSVGAQPYRQPPAFGPGTHFPWPPTCARLSCSVLNPASMPCCTSAMLSGSATSAVILSVI